MRTALQHAWAEVEHDLGYKASEAVPEVIQRRFSRIASLLEIADQEFVSIRSDLSRYRAEVRAALMHQSRPLPLDTVSLAEVVRADVVATLDHDIAAAVGGALGEQTWEPGYVVKLLQHAGLSTTRDVVDAVSAHGERALAMVAPYFAFAKEHLQLDVAFIDQVHRGYGLFFVAHAVMLHGDELGISKVARLARAYQLLDYPDDPKTAQRVASGLVDALGSAR